MRRIERKGGEGRRLKMKMKMKMKGVRTGE